MNPNDPMQNFSGANMADNFSMPEIKPIKSTSMVEPPKPPEIPKVPKPESPIKTILIVILSVTTAVFAGLFIWKFIDWMDASTNLETQISDAVSSAVKTREEELEVQFAEQEKNPLETLTGPEDYGSLSFQYPKTWSVYVSSDALNGGNYVAYLNPGQVQPVQDENSIHALRVTIKAESFDSINSSYTSKVTSGKVTSNVVNVNNNSTTANIYRGQLVTVKDGKKEVAKINGKVAIVKIRDKTAIIQTDSLLFEEDFDKIINSLTFEK